MTRGLRQAKTVITFSARKLQEGPKMRAVPGISHYIPITMHHNNVVTFLITLLSNVEAKNPNLTLEQIKRHMEATL